MLRWLAFISVVVTAASGWSASSVAAPPLARAHAHNDYEHERPLLDAVSHGFRSVEADVWLVDGALLVAHDRDQVRPERTLQALYFDPLKRLVAAGAVDRFTLMIDFKSAGEPTYRALAKVLSEYDELLAKVENGEVSPGPIAVVISGNRPTELIAGEAVRYVGVDGRPSDLDSDAAPHLIPWISENWNSLFSWQGEGEFPEDQRAKLHEFVKQAHQQGRIVRFWATPETPAMWRELLAADVDLINTDQLAELQAFLTEQDDK